MKYLKHVKHPQNTSNPYRNVVFMSRQNCFRLTNSVAKHSLERFETLTAAIAARNIIEQHQNT